MNIRPNSPRNRLRAAQGNQMAGRPEHSVRFVSGAVLRRRNERRRRG
jgi:hypothetical protein